MPARNLKVLMFGWEFPPHISGGLGTACHGLTQSLLRQKTDILFVVPRAHGDETMGVINASDVLIPEPSSADTLQASNLPVVKEKERIQVIPLSSAVVPYTNPFQKQTQPFEQWNYVFAAQSSQGSQTVTHKQYKFSGSYGPDLLEEVKRYSEVAAALASRKEFDIIHAHDWLTFLAGIAAKKAGKKPLVVHVHATEFDRSGEANIDPRIYKIEREGMEHADQVIAVSQWTKDILATKYRIPKQKITVVHNGIIPVKRRRLQDLPRVSRHVVTFLGRITYQKGPRYFVQAAAKVLRSFPDAHFVMAGAGDLMPEMIRYVAMQKMSSRFHFTGFVKAGDVDHLWSVTNVYVMPSVSEPFGISALEAIQSGVPVILSRQSGAAEVVADAIKIDFWDTDALADAICNVLAHKSLSHQLKKKSHQSIRAITWKHAATRVNTLYHEVIAQHQ
jgi:glycosyltransferase involved in cell wall biosynthesis